MSFFSQFIVSKDVLHVGCETRLEHCDFDAWFEFRSDKIALDFSVTNGFHCQQSTVKQKHKTSVCYKQM